MAGCCLHAKSGGRLFSWFARRYRRRFARKGFEPAERHLMDGLERAGYAGASILEIGCGVGYLHQTLLERGAARATGIDLAAGMIDEARAWAGERGLSDRTDYVVGDFVERAAGMSPADVVVLDKVVCCYPDAPGLLGHALAKTGRVCALVYPRDRWFVRLGMRLMGLVMWMVRSDFRPYVHDPEQIEGWLAQGGLSKYHEGRTVGWLSQVWVRE